MPEATNNYSASDLAAERYGNRFGRLPPIYYMNHLSATAFVERIDQAVSSGIEIDPEEFLRGVPDGALI